MKSIASFAIALLLLTAPAFAQKSAVFITKAGAIGGYDPVAYFTESKPVKGTAALKYNWQGADWHFASQQNLNAFKAAPQKYAPQYGGYCAYGTSQGYKAPTEPDAWTVVGDKLYLNYNKKVKETWSKDQVAYIKKADANWPTVAKQE
jgi:YHS domain-containing protein